VNDRTDLTRGRRWVVKVGSALLTDTARGLNTGLISALINQIDVLRTGGVEVVLVSSGAVAAGMYRMGWRSRPHAVYQLQAAAAVGQMGLVQLYESAFQKHGIHTAQVLLTHADLADRKRYLNARSTLRELIELKVVPVINENDTVATEEIQFGDNDTLAALVANLVEADLLVILTDQAGLFTSDPRSRTDVELIPDGTAGDPRLTAMAGPGSVLGRGGMLTKLGAAEKAARSGAATVIADGRENDVLVRLRKGESIGTLLRASRSRMAARKQWLAGQLQVQGRLVLDPGAVKVVRDSGRSLLSVGVTAVHGNFQRGALVVCEDADGKEIARGLVNYSADEARRIMGRSTDKIEAILGYIDEPELVHRDNMVLKTVQ